MFRFKYAVEVLEEGRTHDYAFFPTRALAEAYQLVEAADGYASRLIVGELATNEKGGFP